jgi:hypothetical protein
MIRRSDKLFKLFTGWIASFSLMLQFLCITQFIDITAFSQDSSNKNEKFSILKSSSKQNELKKYVDFLITEEKEKEEDELASEKIKRAINLVLYPIEYLSLIQFNSRQNLYFSSKSKFHLFQQKPLYLLHNSWKYHI